MLLPSTTLLTPPQIKMKFGFTPEAEILNARLAMLGFVIAVGTYMTTGQILPGILWWLGRGQHCGWLPSFLLRSITITMRMMTTKVGEPSYQWLSHLPDNLNIFLRHKEMVTDLWQDMSTLNSLYEELCWDPDEELEFKPDFTNDCIVIRRKEKE